MAHPWSSKCLLTEILSSEKLWPSFEKDSLTASNADLRFQLRDRTLGKIEPIGRKEPIVYLSSEFVKQVSIRVQKLFGSGLEEMKKV